MPHILKNPDGTVNLDAVKKETDFLKGKYAQNAENAKRNAAREQELKQASSDTHAPQAPQVSHGDIVPPKAGSSQ
ncbi:hypothetical protein EX895_003972 [Sporisorium graminicola]|uniref:Uncharacterized protein n=1 Tax=Sporisorium graminicola TaxID=280036 RepID=A0A4U7KRW1_9BASI|nr:hypothetical protein EX895_003972 [Sporisorium graminicola]TKY87295.1 hypothetical protein EX895_003972 [Sporisorium graminicola]